jgi:hypothetical protein
MVSAFLAYERHLLYRAYELRYFMRSPKGATMPHLTNVRFSYSSLFVSLILLLLSLSLLLALSPAASAQAATLTCPPDGTTRLYVSQGGSDVHSGINWANALPTLQDALYLVDRANCPDLTIDEIWVAAGVYYPDEGQGQIENSRRATFKLRRGLSIYGGFAGTESAQNERDWETNLTVLSGDIQQDDLTTASGVVMTTDHLVGLNSYHVVSGSATDGTAILDGFIITAGWANGVRNEAEGGGMYTSRGSPMLRNISFIGNKADWGGGMHNEDNSYPTLTSVFFSGNFATYEGGGLNNFASHPTLIDVSFSDNWSAWGGGMHNTDASAPTLTNVSFIGNRAQLGGAMFNNVRSSPKLTNVTFRANSAEEFGGGIYNWGGPFGGTSDPVLTDVSFIDNKADWGGAIFNETSNPFLSRVSFADNSARIGGGIVNSGSHPTLTSVSFTGNSAEYGGGMYNYASSPMLTSVFFSDNSAEEGGGMTNEGANPTIVRSIFWNNKDNSGTGTASASIHNIDDSTLTIEFSYVQGMPDARLLDWYLWQLLSAVTALR